MIKDASYNLLHLPAVRCSSDVAHFNDRLSCIVCGIAVDCAIVGAITVAFAWASAITGWVDSATSIVCAVAVIGAIVGGVTCTVAISRTWQSSYVSLAIECTVLLVRFCRFTCSEQSSSTIICGITSWIASWVTNWATLNLRYCVSGNRCVDCFNILDLAFWMSKFYVSNIIFVGRKVGTIYYKGVCRVIKWIFCDFTNWNSIFEIASQIVAHSWMFSYLNEDLWLGLICFEHLEWNGLKE